jgi:hypothetical protein
LVVAEVVDLEDVVVFEADDLEVVDITGTEAVDFAEVGVVTTGAASDVCTGTGAGAEVWYGSQTEPSVSWRVQMSPVTA